MRDIFDEAMDWIANMAITGTATPDTIGEFIRGIPDEDLRQEVARIHLEHTGEHVLKD